MDTSSIRENTFDKASDYRTCSCGKPPKMNYLFSICNIESTALYLYQGALGSQCKSLPK